MPTNSINVKMSTCPLLIFSSPLPSLPYSFLSQVFSSPFYQPSEQFGHLNHAVVIASAVQCGGLISKAPWLFLEVQLHCDWCFIKPFLQLWHFREKQAGSECSICRVHLPVPPHFRPQPLPCLHICSLAHSSPRNSSLFPSVLSSIFPLASSFFFIHIFHHNCVCHLGRV